MNTIKEMAVIDSSFDKYLNNGFDSIQGWPGSKQSVYHLKVFKDIFDEERVSGGAFEIGVHHGKYFIALHNLLDGQFKSLGMDVFEDQEKNIDKSGAGNRDICEENIARFAIRPDRCSLKSMDSLAIRDVDIKAISDEFECFSLISIDGGHTKFHVCQDFNTSCKLISYGGVIIVDDIFHPDWPGVTEGVFDILRFQNYVYVPFMITRKKLFLCHLSLQEKYIKSTINKLKPISPSLGMKIVSLFSHKILSVAT